MKDDSATSDRRAQKLDRLAQQGRELGDGRSLTVSGFAREDYRCLACGIAASVPKQAAYQVPVHCHHCRRVELHERVR